VDADDDGDNAAVLTAAPTALVHNTAAPTALALLGRGLHSLTSKLNMRTFGTHRSR
jgi:hypothetical protein